MMKRALCAGVIVTLIFISPLPAFAVGSGGFENATFSAKQLALGGTGTATPDEPAAISFNPAGIVDLPGIQFQGDASFLSLKTFYKSNTQGDTSSTGTLQMVPTSYITINPGKILNDRIAFGVGMDSPFGLATKYNSVHPISRYTGYHNWIKMYAIKPVMAIKVADWFSIGGGPIYYRMFDFGSVMAYPNNAAMNPLWGFPSLPDGQLRANLSGNSWGWQLGALLKPHPKHRLGFYFRSPVNMLLKGLIKVENANFPVALGGSGIHSFETGGHAKLALPLNFTFGYAYQINEKAHIEADFTYSNWGNHKRLYINADPVNQVDDALLRSIGTSDKDYSGSYGLQLGGDYKLTPKLTLRAGSYFYWTPVPKDHWTPALPDSNRLCFSLGAGYAISKYLVLDFAYWNQFFLRRRIGNSIAENTLLVQPSSVDGTYFSYLQAFTLSLTLKWDDAFKWAQKDDVKSLLAPNAGTFEIAPA